MKSRFLFVLLLLVSLLLGTFFYSAAAWTPVAVDTDPLVRMPGTQPGQVSLSDSDQCMNCHSGYDTAVEPGHNWQGSMMAQSARDFLFFATMTVAAQDAIWAIGNPNATDICLRCHFPRGWLNGRSDPTNVSLMTGSDFDGVQCTVCHFMFDPFFETTYDGSREGSDWSGYWDETDASGTPSSAAALETYLADQGLAANITLFNGDPFYNGNLPPAAYTENGSGQYFFSDTNQRRASFADADASHPMLYSRYHKSKYFCSTCHDISNPVLLNQGADPSQPLPTETQSPYTYYHVERTFSEFMLSDYGLQGGAAGIGPFAPVIFNTSRPNDAIASCQDCHMRDVTGRAADQNRALIRPTESTEHPNSGLPLHDLTGGNVWVPTILASTETNSSNYDATNAALLGNRVSELTLDLTAGQGLNAAALLDGADRALQMLQDAATIDNLNYDIGSGDLTFQIQNQTGHKLISGFPEGRRMFINVRYYDSAGTLLYEVNPYDDLAATLKGLTGYTYDDPNNVLPDPASLGANEAFVDELVYEMHPSSSVTGETESFHFVLGTDRYKDNRIPPKGFRIAEAATRLSEPVWQGVSDPNYFTTAEYAGGYDAVALSDYGVQVMNVVTAEVRLYYQTTSREYIEFLRNEINGSGDLTLNGTGAGGDPPYLIQSDPFFSNLAAWGDTIWDVWVHNRDLPGAAPVLMAQGQWSEVPTAVTVQNLSVQATPGLPIPLVIGLVAFLLVTSLLVQGWRRS